MSDIEVDATYTFTRPTHLLNGVFVFQNSQVRVLEVGEKIKVEYVDREGLLHTIEDVKPEELEA